MVYMLNKKGPSQLRKGPFYYLHLNSNADIPEGLFVHPR